MNDNMDEPEKHYAKLDIPGTKKQIVHDNHLYQKPNIVKLAEVENRMVVSKVWDKKE